MCIVLGDTWWLGTVQMGASAEPRPGAAASCASASALAAQCTLRQQLAWAMCNHLSAGVPCVYALDLCML